MSITTQSDEHRLSNTDQKSAPIRLRVPNVATCVDGQNAESGRDDPSAGKSVATGAAGSGKIRLGRRIASRSSEDPENESEPECRPGRKLRSRLWAAAMALTCLSGAALLFGVFEGNDVVEEDDQFASYEDSHESGNSIVPRETGPAAPEVVAAELQTIAGSGAAPAVSPAQYETRRFTMPDGTGPQGARLDGTIQFDDSVHAQSSTPHGAH
jgi:hypothetical protein